MSESETLSWTSSLSEDDRSRLVSNVLSLGGHGGFVAAVRSAGVDVTDARRDELLANVRDGRHVEVELDVRAFEQKAGESNHNYLQFTPSALHQLGRSAAGMPFIRDHEQGNALARAGTITSATTEKMAEGHYVLWERVKLTAPWAVDLALRGLISSVSIGWHPTGPVMCSACDRPVLEECFHFPGDRLETVTEKGEKRKRYASAASETAEVVEWITTRADKTETSIVNVPAVPRARIEEVRAALSAALGIKDSATTAARKEVHMMDRLARALGAADATEDAMVRRAEALSSELGIANTDLRSARAQIASLDAELGVLRAEAATASRAEFLRAGISEGKLSPGDRDAWGALFDANQARARELLAARAPQSATPVGGQLQSAATPAPVTPPGDEQLREVGASRAGVAKILRQFGVDKTAADKMLDNFDAAAVFGESEEVH